MTNCGGGCESCCTTLDVVANGPFDRTYTSGADGGPTGGADPATVSSFKLDKYLVTVGRFRQFVAAWDGSSGLDGGPGYEPSPGSGKHTHLNGGLGLALGPNVDAGQRYESGWLASDDDSINPTTYNLISNCTTTTNATTWTKVAGTQENLPINCVDWAEAYAFCIWDGGFLPTEAEWEYAAAGGSKELEYPWGATPPGADSGLAIFGCYYPTGQGDGSAGGCTGVANIAPVGAPTAGAGLWGHLDMAGEMYEWNLDWFRATYLTPWNDCAYLSDAGASNRLIRGGYFGGPEARILPTYRAGADPRNNNRRDFIGLRCARVP
jgi:formylglycine-generating enzyme required for sulfatase activity